MSSSSNVKGTVAILGGTGDLGESAHSVLFAVTNHIPVHLLTGLRISRVLLTEYRTQFPVVRVTTRDPNSPKAQELAKLGAELRRTSESFDDVLSGVDVVINAFNTEVIEKVGKELTAAVARVKPKVYFLSEYGV